MEGVHYLMALLCLALAVDGEGDRLVDIDEEETVEGSSNQNQMCSPCQCQCNYPPPPLASSHDNTPKASVDLTDIQAALDSNTDLLRAIATQVGFAQHDLESPRGTGCPDDFLFDRKTNTCLQYHVDGEVAKLNWAQAQGYCQHLGPKTHLATIDTQDKLELVRGHLRQPDLPATNGGWGRQAWIGGLQSKDGSQWFWAATGEALAHQRGGMWGPGEPSNGAGGTEDCVTLTSGTGRTRRYKDWMMNDARCRMEHLYICEHHLN